MIRERFNENPIDKILTYSDYIGMVQEEPIILHYVAQKLKFQHWVEHLLYFWSVASNEPPDYTLKGDFNVLKEEIHKSLVNSGFIEQSIEILSCTSEEELNKTIIRQYTDETPLYKKVNKELRASHNYQNTSEVPDDYIKMHLSTLSAWILQLNTAIRLEKPYTKKSYRGAYLKKYEIDEYKENEIIIWAPFISASKVREFCLDGNVIFEITTESAMSLYDKRFARDVSRLSIFPEEQEVIFPIACAYRVLYKKIENGKNVIGLATVDYN